ncbi:hypothetical protein [Micromonospora sp. NPDC048830]|uniref:hypothetical protein n=1 Tax=Micromonospora sp. NPDC048830 TaxID=3364257 RepID=UPI00371F45BD
MSDLPDAGAPPADPAAGGAGDPPVAAARRDPAAATAAAVTALRPRDLVSFTVRTTGLRERVSATGVAEWVAADADGQLIVDLPPQHLAESVLAPGSTTSQGRLAGPSSLYFRVPRNQVVAQSVEGVLAAMNTLPLIVEPRERGRASALELPWRLLLALDVRARCRHRSAPPPAGDAVSPMWHTRIVAPTASGYADVYPFASLPVESSFGTPLGTSVTTIADQGCRNPTQPVATEKLILTACGAWFSGSVDYPALQWTHRAAMGRDYYVRLHKRGALFPFGHRAAVVEVTERRFDTATKVAGLQRTIALIVTEPVCRYGIDASHEREFPFQRVEIEPVQIVPLDQPDDEHTFWPRQGGTAVQFTIRAWAAGEAVTMRLPLLFGDGTLTAQQLGDTYARGPRTGIAAAAPPAAVVNRFIPLAVRRTAQQTVEAVEGASQQVAALVFGANPVASGVGFHPRLAQIDVTLPAVKQLLGQDMPAIPATLAPEVRASTATTPPDFLLQFASRSLNLGFAQTGAIASPNMAVNRIHRVLGATVANLPTNPAQLFDRGAKLLGIVPLAEIVSTVDRPPTIVWSQTPTPQATLEWTMKPTRSSGPFQPVTAPPAKACEVRITARTGTGDGSPKTTVFGAVTNFVIGIPTPADPLVRLDFSELTFRAETGKLPTTAFTITSAALGRKLRFVQRLGKHLAAVGRSAPTVEISARDVRVRYAVAIPTPLGMGLFTLQNLRLQAGVTLSFVGEPVTLDFAFGTRGSPFLVTVMGFGGGGYLELGVRAGGTDSGLERFVGGIEFGASVAMSFGVASGEVHVFGGIVFVKQRGEVEITGYLRIGGSVRVLGLISVSVELTISLTYVVPNKLRGAAKLVIAVDLTFWSTSVEITCEKTFVGSEQTLAAEAVCAPATGFSVEKALGPVGSSFPWRDYCQAFAGG